ncbi:hypothetical protein MJO29_010967 [Puccinia striiformis f. sp. tritici]|nr:hypothetical protein Pst134EB_021668 [Puccinia striiformis f. sp. tritici]KAI7946440.1 hypothetical protein MJO29_010967 [Puccinia striiformis f. sp. tritici]
MVTIKRSESPIPLAPHNHGTKYIPAPEHHQISAFPQFSYHNGLRGFTLPGMGDESSTESCPPSVYHHPPGSYHLNPTVHSGFSSPTSNHSSPNPYGDFNAFPLSPPSTGTTLSALITQPHNPSHGPLTHQLPHQPLSSNDLSSAICPSTAFELNRTGHPYNLTENRYNRRESYSTPVTGPSYERRHSTVSVGSLCRLQSSSPYPTYAALEPHPTAPSQVYALGEDLSTQGMFYMDSGRHNVPLPSVKTSCGGMQAGMMAETPRLTHHHIPQMPSSVPPPSKLTTRQYRKKPPPEVCAVCPSKETPEWRKGPSGLRTLCNACGLTAAKLALKEPKCIEDVWAQLLEIGTTRFRTQYVFEEHQKAAAARSWSAQWQSQAGGRTGNSNRSSYSSSTGSPATKSSRPTFSNTAGSYTKVTSNRNHAEIVAAHQLFALGRARKNDLSGLITDGEAAQF